MPLLQTPGTKFRVHWEGDRECSLMFEAWPKMESSSGCFLLPFSSSWDPAVLGLLVGGHAEVVSARLNWSHGTIDVRGAGNFLSSV